jgi:hypothetical protein
MPSAGLRGPLQGDLNLAEALRKAVESSGLSEEKLFEVLHQKQGNSNISKSEASVDHGTIPLSLNPRKKLIYPLLIEKTFRTQCAVHKFVILPGVARYVVDHPIFQRMREIKQLGVANYVYPGAVGRLKLNRTGDGEFMFIRER